MGVLTKEPLTDKKEEYMIKEQAIDHSFILRQKNKLVSGLVITARIQKGKWMGPYNKKWIYSNNVQIRVAALE